MKKYLLLLFIVANCYDLHAQLLTTTPNFPKDNGSISIVVDCTKGNKGLMNYANTSDVYVHLGVITSRSTGPTNWLYSPFTWATTNATAKATSLGGNKYQYDIANIRTFFGVPAGETILRIAILFRNGDGSLAQRNAATRSRSNSRSVVLRVSEAARSSSARASSTRPSLARKSPRTVGNR